MITLKSVYYLWGKGMMLKWKGYAGGSGFLEMSDLLTWVLVT